MEVSVTQRIALGKALRTLRELHSNETDANRSDALVAATDRLLSVLSIYGLIDTTASRT